MGESSTAPKRGALLGERYRLDELIDTGGMASVWRATDDLEGGEVAVKVLSDTLAHDPDFVKRFAREAELAAQLDHPSIVAVTDFASGERPFLVMELVEHGTLADRIAERRKIDAVALASELLAALVQIHAAGVIHRDVKPANILIDEEESAKLTDFGIAQPADATRYTQAGQLVGTFHYMAPEVADGATADARSDLYSLGAVLADCSPPKSLSGLIDVLTRKDPDERPADARTALALLPSSAEVEQGDRENKE